MNLDNHTRHAAIDPRKEVQRRSTQLNSLAGISRLLPKYLCQIFIEYRKLETRDDPESLTWIKISHVCRSWRATALEHVGLWTDISSKMNDGCLDTFVARAKSELLSVWWHWESLGGPERFQLKIVPIMNRVRSLDFALPGTGFQTMLLLFQVPPTAALEAFSLRLSDTLASSHLFTTNSKWYLYQVDAPLLRRLELQDCMLSPPAAFCNQLTTFTWSSSMVEQSYPPRALLDILQEMPALERLTLIAPYYLYNNEYWPPPVISSPATSLPSLKFLEVSSSASGCAGLLLHLSVPTECIVNISVARPFFVSWPILPWPTLSSAISTVWRSTPRFIALSIEQDPSSGMYTWRMGSETLISGVNFDEEMPPVAPQLVVETPVLMLPLMSRALPLHHVRYLTLGPYEPYKNSDGKAEVTLEEVELFDFLPSLEDTVMIGGKGQAIIGYLQKDLGLSQADLLSPSGEPETGKLHLPYLLCITFQEDKFVPRISRKYPRQETSMNDLEEVVRLRRRLGFPLSEIVFSKCEGVDHEYAEGLRELGLDVDHEDYASPFIDYGSDNYSSSGAYWDDSDSDDSDASTW